MKTIGQLRQFQKVIDGQLSGILDIASIEMLLEESYPDIAERVMSILDGYKTVDTSYLSLRLDEMCVDDPETEIGPSSAASGSIEKENGT